MTKPKPKTRESALPRRRSAAALSLQSPRHRQRVIPDKRAKLRNTGAPGEEMTEQLIGVAMTDTLDFTQDEMDVIKELIPRARVFDSPAAVKAAIEANEIVYALAPEKASPVGYAFIVLKGENRLRELSLTGGHLTELVVKCRTPGEALWLHREFGEKNILQ